jgi:hypothetical protein
VLFGDIGVKVTERSELLLDRSLLPTRARKLTLSDSQHLGMYPNHCGQGGHKARNTETLVKQTGFAQAVRVVLTLNVLFMLISHCNTPWVMKQLEENW